MLISPRPPRKIGGRSPHRRTIYLALPWLQSEHVICESMLEASFVRVAALCPYVRSIHHQPFRFDIGSPRGYTPDFYLALDGRPPIIVEVKPYDHIPEHRERLAAAAQLIEAQGSHYLLCTDRELSDSGIADRASLVLRHTKSFLPESVIAELSSGLLRFGGTASVADVAKLLNTEPERAMYLIGRRYLSTPPGIDLNNVFNTTEVEKRYGNIPIDRWFGSEEGRTEAYLASVS